MKDPELFHEDGLIDWNRDSRFIDRFVRAQTRPYPGAYTYLNGERITIWSARSIEEEVSLDLPAGSIIGFRGHPAVVCGQGLLLLCEVETTNGAVLFEDEMSRSLLQGTVLKNFRS